MFMAPGNTPKSEMLKSVERGIWVTRFWYTRVVHPMKVLITGMTRDGTFLIENGEVTRPVKEFPFYHQLSRRVEQRQSDQPRNETLPGRLERRGTARARAAGGRIPVHRRDAVTKKRRTFYERCGA